VSDSIETAIFHPRAKKLLDLALSLNKAINIDDILSELGHQPTSFLSAEHIRLFNYDAVENEVYTMVKLSDTFVEFTFPATEKSVAGYTALHREVIALDNVNDPENLEKYPGLKYDNRYENRAGVKVKSILSIPILENEADLIGIIQLVNMGRTVSEYAADIDFLVHLGMVVAASLFHHDGRQPRATKFDFLLEEGLVSPEEVGKALGMAAKNTENPIEGDAVSILVDTFGVPVRAMQASLSRYGRTLVYRVLC